MVQETQDWVDQGTIGQLLQKLSFEMGLKYGHPEGGLGPFVVITMMEI